MKTTPKLQVYTLLSTAFLFGYCEDALGEETGQNDRRPDTLLLEQRAALAINCLATNQDSRRDGQPYFQSNVVPHPDGGYGVRAVHLVWDYGDCTGRFSDALLLVRLMSGSRTHPEADARLRHFMLSLIREDGLSWIPDNPCDRRGNSISAWSIANTMRALVNHHLLYEDPESKKYLERMIDGYIRIAVKEPDYWYWPDELYRGQWSTHNPPRAPTGSGYEWGTFVRGLSRYYEEVRDPKVKELIEKSTRFVIEKSGDFAPDGTYRTWHTHGRTLMASGILHYALLENREDWARWARNVYDFTHDKLSTEFGWVPERIHSPDTGSETCAVADMVELAIMLAESGHEEYWNHAERFVRNHLVESQVTDISSLKPLPRGPPADPSLKYSGEQWKFCTRTEGAAQMQLGGFAGRSAPNDIVANLPHMIQHCCTGHGARALYVAWHHIVTKRPDAVYVNMALSRDTKWVEVNSYRPYQGKLEIVIHDAPNLAVRIPDWVDPGQVKVTLEGEPVSFTHKGSYAKLVGLTSGQKVIVTHPLRGFTETVKVGSHQYQVEWRGDTVVSIQPPGKILPLYQREYMKNDKTPLKKLVYHVPENEIDW